MPFVTKPVKDFIGTGLTFPIELQNGKGVLKTGFELIRSSINNILAFEISSRFYLGEFGSRMQELIEEPNDQVLENLINTFIIDAITTWEKRITQISTSIVHVDDTKILVELVYKVLNSQNTDNFIYPFYRQINN